MQNFLPLGRQPSRATSASGPASAETRSGAGCIFAQRMPTDWRTTTGCWTGWWRSCAICCCAHRRRICATPGICWDCSAWAMPFRKLAAGAQHEVHELFTRSAGEMLDGWFESDAIKALLGFDAVVGCLSKSLRAGQRLRAAAPRLRRDQWQDRRLGPCHRWHGLNHSGHGREARRLGVDIHLDGPVAQVRATDDQATARLAPPVCCCRTGVKSARDSHRGKHQSEAAVHPFDRCGAVAGGLSRTHSTIPLRIGHFPHERGAVGTAAIQWHAHIRCTPGRRHHHGAVAGFHGSGLLSARAEGIHRRR